MTWLLSASGLQHRFGPTVALRGADLGVAAGEILALSGPSGSGKTTLLHALAGILVPDAGTVTYLGRAISALDETQRAKLRRNEFGFVFQFGQLVPDLPAVENVALPLLLAGTGRQPARAAALAGLDRLGLSALADRLPGELSGGQAQRVAVARALVNDPKIVFADEPTGALDTVSGDQVMELLVEQAREHGAAVVTVTHEPRVAAYADRRVTVRDGAVTNGRPAPPAVAVRP